MFNIRLQSQKLTETDKMPITQKQKDVAARVRKHIKNKTEWRAEVLRNVRKENEYMDEKIKAQKPTRKQMEAPFNSPEIK